MANIQFNLDTNCDMPSDALEGGVAIITTDSPPASELIPSNFQNMDFETGDFTGWGNTSYGNMGSPTPTSDFSVTSGAKYSGNYGMRLYMFIPSTWDEVSFMTKEQPHRGAYFDNLSFWYKINQKANLYKATFALTLTTKNGTATAFSVSNPTAGEWIYVSIKREDITLSPGDYWDAYTTLTVSASSGANAPNGVCEIFLDDIVFTPGYDPVPQPLPIAAVATISSASGSTVTLSDDNIILPGWIADSGKILLVNGYKVDFAPDLSPPESIATWRVNKEVFNFNDNDDKKKLVTSVIVRGKDTRGKSISVSLEAIHRFDEERRFFEQSTFVNKKSEGYVYKNSYATDKSVECTVVLGDTDVNCSVTFPGSDKTLVNVGSTGFPLHSPVTFTDSTGWDPSPLVLNELYYIVYRSGNYIKVSATDNGTPITFKWKSSDISYNWEFSSEGNASGETLTVDIKGVQVASIWIEGNPADSGSVIAAKIAAACDGYIDADGNTWTVTSNSYNTYFRCHDEGLNWNSAVAVNATYCSPNHTGDSVPATYYPRATTPSTIQADNLDGWFTQGMQLIFGAEEMPTGLSADTIYTVSSTPALSATATFLITAEGNIVTCTTVGSGLMCYKPNTIHNLAPDGQPALWLYGWDFTIPSGSNLALSIPNSGETPATLVTTGEPQEAIDVNGTKYTAIPIGDWIQPIDYSGAGFCLGDKLYVDDPTYLPNTGTNQNLSAGDEKFVSASTSTDDNGDYVVFSGGAASRVTSSSKKAYPHGLGALVMCTDTTGFFGDPDSPIQIYGRNVGDFTVDSQIQYGDLDAYATALLIGKGVFYKKATCWGNIWNLFVKRIGEYIGVDEIHNYGTQISRSTPPRIGDKVSIINFTGATPVDYEIVALTIKPDEGIIQLELGDFERNVFTTLNENTTALHNTIT